MTSVKLLKHWLHLTSTNCHKPALIVALFSVLITSCTNSEFVLSIFYNRLGDRLSNSILKHGKFSELQTAALENSVGAFHAWHRQTQLPEYAKLLKTISNSIAEPSLKTTQMVGQWVTQARRYRQTAMQCHPLNFSIEPMRTLSDEQLIAIEQGLVKERKKHGKEWSDITAEQRIELQFEKIEKWASRVNININAEQRLLLRGTLVQQKYNYEYYQERSEQWFSQLFNLARDQESADYRDKMKTLIDQRWGLWETINPEASQHDRKLWQSFLVKFIDSMTPAQRRDFVKWNTKMSANIKSISQQEPEFPPADDPSIGCVVKLYS